MYSLWITTIDHIHSTFKHKSEDDGSNDRLRFACFVFSTFYLKMPIQKFEYFIRFGGNELESHSLFLFIY